MVLEIIQVQNKRAKNDVRRNENNTIKRPKCSSMNIVSRSVEHSLIQIDELININNQLLCEIITTHIALEIQCEMRDDCAHTINSNMSRDRTLPPMAIRINSNININSRFFCVFLLRSLLARTISWVCVCVPVFLVLCFAFNLPVEGTPNGSTIN